MADLKAKKKVFEVRMKVITEAQECRVGWEVKKHVRKKVLANNFPPVEQ